MVLGTTLNKLTRHLAAWSETPELDVQVLLAHVLGRSRTWVLAHPEAEITVEQHIALEDALTQLERGVPLPYLLGHWEFFGLDFTLSSATLIPRPETELLVEYALTWLQANPHKQRAIDVGTGSGCIAVTLAVKIRDLHVVASDVTLPTLQVARFNASRHGVADRVHCVQADLLSMTCGPFDLICANLPYIPTGTLKGLKVYGREPVSALDGGADGLELIRRLLLEAPLQLAQGGLLLLEIEADQGKAVLALATKTFPATEVHILNDLAGMERLVVIHSQTR